MMKATLQAPFMHSPSCELLAFHQEVEGTTEEGPNWERQLQMLVALCRGKALPAFDAEETASLARLAELHGLLPVFESALLKTKDAAEAWPDLVASVKQRRLQEVRRALGMAAETLRVVRELEEAGIAVVPFKGCILAQMAHGDCGTRNSCDIDLFVRKSELEAAIKVLQSAGYILEPSWGKVVKEGHFWFDCECGLLNPERGTCIDLHWEFTARNFSLAMPVDRLFSRLAPFQFHGRTIRTFQKEDLLIILCLHACKHYWQKLEWPYTIAKFIERHPDLDWRTIMHEAASMRVDRLLASGLLMAHYLFRTVLPDEVLMSIMPDATAWRIIRRSMQWMAHEPGYTPSPFQVRRFHSWGRRTFMRKAQYWLGVVTTPTEKDYHIPVPRSLPGSLYLIRLVRLSLFPLVRLFHSAPDVATSAFPHRT